MVSMNKIKNSVRRFKYYLKHNFLSIENIVLCVAIVMCLTLTYQSIEAMSRNWELVERLNSEQKALDLLNIEIETAELENEYYNSAEYQELAARKFANKQLPGEKMVYLPENSEVAKTKHQKKHSQPQSKQPVDKSNFEKWMAFLFP